MRNSVNQLFMQRVSTNGVTRHIMCASNGKAVLLCLIPRLTNYNAPSIKQVNTLLKTGALAI